MTEDFDLRIADLFDIPPHFLGTGRPEHRRTWRLRRRIRIIRRKLRTRR